MAEHTKIEWTDSTFNPWIGCTKIAPACDHCYAAAIDKRVGGDHWGNVPRRRTSAANWHEPIKWQRRADEFYAEHGRRRRVFCASMADVFDNQVPEAWRDDLWQLISETPDLDWLLLTKRPQNIEKMLPMFWHKVKGHVWLGTTVEDQQHADKNIPHLLQHDSAVRFISAEPLLEGIDLTTLCPGHYFVDALRGLKYHDAPEGQFSGTAPTGKLDWVIAGGESGPHARPSNPKWFRALRNQCAEAGTAFLFKQWGEFVSVSEVEGKGRHFSFPDGRTVRRVGKKAAGRSLDGVTHDAMPAVQ